MMIVRNPRAREAVAAGAAAAVALLVSAAPSAAQQAPARSADSAALTAQLQRVTRLAARVPVQTRDSVFRLLESGTGAGPVRRGAYATPAQVRALASRVPAQTRDSVLRQLTQALAVARPRR